MRIRSRLNFLKWLYPGMQVKRWLILVPIGMVIIVLGIALLFNWRIEPLLNDLVKGTYSVSGINITKPALLIPLSLVLIFIGMVLMFTGLRQVVRSITSVVSPEAAGKLADVMFQRRSLAQGRRIVVIGGGTGLSTMLRGLKQYSSNIVAVVTVTDDGGSSGRLQREMGVLPPGDIRNCLVALADAEPAMTELFQYRFQDDGQGLEGHSFGNLLIAAMTRITGDFESAIRQTSNILAIRGLVLPSTNTPVRLQAEMDDGQLAEGETDIVKYPSPIKHIMLHPSNVEPLEETLRSIELADCIVLGPGSVYTSIIPNLLVDGIAKAIEESNAAKIYVCNVMTQPGETDGFTASDHVRAILRHTDRRVFHYVLVNIIRPNQDLLARYEKVGQKFVEPDSNAIRSLGFRPILGDFISETDVVRHDSTKLGQAILRLAR